MSRSILNLVEDDIIDDPTLSRDENKECEECHKKGCVFFQAHGDGDDAMALINAGISPIRFINGLVSLGGLFLTLFPFRFSSCSLS